MIDLFLPNKLVRRFLIDVQHTAELRYSENIGKTLEQQTIGIFCRC